MQTIMKRFSVVAVMLAIILIPCVAQKVTKGSLSVLKNEKQLNMVCDFTNCIIDKKPAYYQIQKEGDNWEKGVSEIIFRFGEGVSKKVRTLIVGQFPDAKYTLYYALESIDDDQDCFGTIFLKDTQTGEIIAEIKKAYGSAGMFGSFFNLLGDAFEDLGKKIGMIIKKPSRLQGDWPLY